MDEPRPISGLGFLLDHPEERSCRRLIDAHQTCGRRFTAQYRPQWICSPCVNERVRLSAIEHRHRILNHWLSRLASVGIVDDLARMTLDRFDPQLQPEAFAAIGMILDGGWMDGRNLVMTGTNGVGKTHLAAGACIKLFDLGLKVAFLDVMGFSQIIGSNASFDDKAQAEKRYLGPCWDADLTVIDDLGRARTDARMMTTMDALINRRWLSHKTTIITANMTEEELFTSVLSNAAASRLLDPGDPIRLREGDFRARRVRLPPPKAPGDPSRVCRSCAGAGFVLSSRFAPSNPERLQKCPSCDGRGF